jgi:hypothetical protein
MARFRRVELIGIIGEVMAFVPSLIMAQDKPEGTANSPGRMGIHNEI